MDQTHGFQQSSLKLWSVNFTNSLEIFRNIFFHKSSANTRLLGLSKHLKNWNSERICSKSVSGHSLELSVEDVQALKEMIYAACHAATKKCSEVFLDQVLFLAIGAIQVQSQTGSDKAWDLVNQSINESTRLKKENRVFLLGLVVTAFVISLSAITHTKSETQTHHNVQLESPLKLTAEPKASSATTHALLLAYNKMKSGVCQLPQAAMLPPEQRHAFLLFVNNGAVEVQNVENLRLALGYVNCLYPQELMRSPAPL